MVIESYQKSLGDKALSVGYKFGGWTLRLKAIGLFATGVILIIIGILLSFVSSSFGGGLKSIYGFLLFSLFGLLAILGGWFYWRRARSLVKGRFY